MRARVVAESRRDEHVAPIAAGDVHVTAEFRKAARRELQHGIAYALDEMRPIIDQCQVRSAALEQQLLDSRPLTGREENVNACARAVGQWKNGRAVKTRQLIG